MRRAQGGKEFVVGFVGGSGVHLLLAGRSALHALEMLADVVVGGVRVRARLRVRSPFGRAGARPSRFCRHAEIHVADDAGAVERTEEVGGDLVLQFLLADGRWITRCHAHIIPKPASAVKSGARRRAHLRNSLMRIEFWKQPEQLSKTTLSYGHTLNVLALGIVRA